MPEFLTLISPEVALGRWFDVLPCGNYQSERIKTFLANNRVTAEDIYARIPLPEFPRSTVDGYAVTASDTYGASESLPVYLQMVGEIPMGGEPGFALHPGQTALIHTGGMLPNNANAVVMLEQTQNNRQDEIEILSPVTPKENILQTGEDVQAGDLVIPRGTLLRTAEIGGLMALGYQKIDVVRKPRLAILSSGDEVVAADMNPLPGQVRDINSHILGAQVTEWCGEPVLMGIVPDDIKELSELLNKSLDICDGAIITAGSSASVRDMTSLVIEKTGNPGVIVHGLNIRPGKPTILAVCEGKPVIGLPGNPVSALVIGWLFLPPLLDRMQGVRTRRIRNRISASLLVNQVSQAGREDWIPVRLLENKGDFQVEPVFFKSNLIFNLVKSIGLMHIPADVTGYSAGERVQVYLF